MNYRYLVAVFAPLAFALPLILLGIGHGFLVPPALAGTVSLVPALAGSAAAGATAAASGAGEAALVAIKGSYYALLGWLVARPAGLAPAVRLLREFVGVPQGVKFVVDLRAELLALSARGAVGHRPANPSSAAVTADHLVNELPLSSAYTLLFAVHLSRKSEDGGITYARLPRERVIVAGPTACACCGGTRLSKLGEDITETLEVVPRQWKVIQTVREKFSCRDCEKIAQAPAPFHVVPRGWAGPSFLAML